MATFSDFVADQPSGKVFSLYECSGLELASPSRDFVSEGVVTLVTVVTATHVHVTQNCSPPSTVPPREHSLVPWGEDTGQ